jgi:xanthine dehydrogenase YagS FAD-binding subunit
MEKFEHFNVFTITEAVEMLRRYQGRANVIAGGTDLLGKMKDQILPTYPEALINLNMIPNFDYIKEENGVLRVGPLAILEDIATNPLIKQKYSALAEAARRTASPHLREMGTIGGNICQDIRCWFYRNPDNRFPCLRKGGGRCYAIEGDNRYHSIFGGSVDGGCYAVHPSDTAPALIALGARIKTSKRYVEAEGFFSVDVTRTTVLDHDEIVTEIEIPEPLESARSVFLKFALRKSIDFPIVNCAVMIASAEGKVMSARICLNAVYVKPYRAFKAEEIILGKAVTDDVAESCAKAAIMDARPLRDNAYMVQIAKVLVKRCVLAAA